MDPNFVEIQTKFSADLHPSTLRNVTGSFQSILDDLLLTYRQRLGGIVLGYHDERIINKTASVHAFFPYFHVDAEATLSVLRLEQDKHLVGRINKLAPDYIGMLVLGAFNAVVHKDQLQGKFEFEKQGGVWVQSSDNTCRLKAGSMVKFAIQRVDVSSSRFLIIGTMLPDSCGGFEPPGGAPAVAGSLGGLGAAVAGDGGGGRGAAALGVRLEEAAVAAPAVAESPLAVTAETQEAPRSGEAPGDGVRGQKKKNKHSKRSSREQERDADPLAAASGEVAEDGAVAPATDADAAVAGDVATDAGGAGDVAAGAAAGSEDAPGQHHKKKKKKKREKSRDEDVEVAAAADEAGADRRNGAAAPDAGDDEAGPRSEEAATAAQQKRKGVAAAAAAPGGIEPDSEAERRAARKEERRRRKAEAAARQAQEAAEEGAEEGAASPPVDCDAAVPGAQEEPGCEVQEVAKQEVNGRKKRKAKSTGASEAAATPENGAAVKKKQKKAGKSQAGRGS